MYAAGKPDPAPAAHNPLTHQKNRHQRHQTKCIYPMHYVDEPVVVDKRQNEHGDQTAKQPEHLFGVEADKFRVQGGAIDLKDADDREQQDEAQEQPVEIAKGDRSRISVFSFSARQDRYLIPAAG